MKDIKCEKCKHFVGNDPRYYGTQCRKSGEDYTGHSNYQESPKCRHHVDYINKPSLFEAKK